MGVNMKICIPSGIGDFQDIYIDISEGILSITQNSYTLVIEPSQEQVFIDMLLSIIKEIK